MLSTYVLTMLCFALVSLAQNVNFVLDCNAYPEVCNNKCYAIYSAGRPDTITWDRPIESLKDARREAAGASPNPCCGPAPRQAQCRDPDGTVVACSSPDEYPYASTMEGGTGAILRCTSWIGNRLEGGQYSGYLTLHEDGGCYNQPGCRITVSAGWPGPETPLCTGRTAHPNDGFELVYDATNDVYNQAKRDLNNETSASGPWRLHEPDPSDFVPLHKRRELLLDNGIRILLLSRDMERDWTNETFLMRNTTARVAREMLGNDRSPYLRLSSPLYHDHDTPYNLPPDTPLPIDPGWLSWHSAGYDWFGNLHSTTSSRGVCSTATTSGPGATTVTVSSVRTMTGTAPSTNDYPTSSTATNRTASPPGGNSTSSGISPPGPSNTSGTTNTTSGGNRTFSGISPPEPSNTSGTTNTTDGPDVVYIDPSIWTEGSPQIACTPPCTLIMPPITLSTPATFNYAPVALTLEIDGPGLGTSMTSLTTTVTTVSFPQLTTSIISIDSIVYNASTPITVPAVGSLSFPAVTLTDPGSLGSSISGSPIVFTYSPGPLSVSSIVTGLLQPLTSSLQAPSLSFTTSVSSGDRSQSPTSVLPIVPLITVTSGTPSPTCSPGSHCGTRCTRNCHTNPPCTAICGIIGPLCRHGCCLGSCDGGAGGDGGGGQSPTPTPTPSPESTPTNTPTTGSCIPQESTNYWVSCSYGSQTTSCTTTRSSVVTKCGTGTTTTTTSAYYCPLLDDGDDYADDDDTTSGSSFITTSSVTESLPVAPTTSPNIISISSSSSSSSSRSPGNIISSSPSSSIDSSSFGSSIISPSIISPSSISSSSISSGSISSSSSSSSSTSSPTIPTTPSISTTSTSAGPISATQMTLSSITPSSTGPISATQLTLSSFTGVDPSLLPTLSVSFCLTSSCVLGTMVYSSYTSSSGTPCPTPDSSVCATPTTLGSSSSITPSATSVAGSMIFQESDFTSSCGPNECTVAGCEVQVSVPGCQGATPAYIGDCDSQGTLTNVTISTDLCSGAHLYVHYDRVPITIDFVSGDGATSFWCQPDTRNNGGSCGSVSPGHAPPPAGICSPLLDLTGTCNKGGNKNTRLRDAMKLNVDKGLGGLTYADGVPVACTRTTSSASDAMCAYWSGGTSGGTLQDALELMDIIINGNCPQCGRISLPQGDGQYFLVDYANTPCNKNNGVTACVCGTLGQGHCAAGSAFP